MAGIDLLSIQPHKVSKDMRGYIVFFFGDPKSGKTTTACQFPNNLLLAFERGYNAIPGAMAQPISSWAQFRQVLRQLKRPEVKEKFQCITIDTVDICYDLCEKYICANAIRPDNTVGVDDISEIGYGKGYTAAAKEFDECLRSIIELDYGLILISHAVDKTFKDENGLEFNKIVPTLGKKPRDIVNRMADIIGYSRIVEDRQTNSKQTRLFLRGTPRYEAGSRFRYTPDSIEFTYENLVNAINDAIDKEAKEKDASLFTDERINLYTPLKEKDFDQLMSDFQNIIQSFVDDNQEQFVSYWQPRITEIIHKYLGKGRKVSDCTREQTEALSLIVSELTELLEKKKA